jgi:hypothetical protein
VVEVLELIGDRVYYQTVEVKGRAPRRASCGSAPLAVFTGTYLACHPPADRDTPTCVARPTTPAGCHSQQVINITLTRRCLRSILGTVDSK